MSRLIIVITSLAFAAGCTSQSTREAINRYHQTQGYAAVAFANAYRTAQEQLFLATRLKLAGCDSDEQRQEVLKAYAQARTGIEVARVQFDRAQHLSLLTVGQYLYDRQGWLNVLFEDQAGQLGRVMDAARSGDAAAGTTLEGVVWGLKHPLDPKAREGPGPKGSPDE